MSKAPDKEKPTLTAEQKEAYLNIVLELRDSGQLYLAAGQAIHHYVRSAEWDKASLLIEFMKSGAAIAPDRPSV